MKKAKSTGIYFLDNFFLLRPVVLIPVWGFALFGYFQGHGGKITGLPKLWHGSDASIFFWIVVFSISAGSVYVLNQIADIEVDKKNGGFPLLANGVVSRLNAWIIAGIAAIVSIAVPFFSGHEAIGFLSAATIILGIAYSFRPCFFSGRPFFDFLSNAAGFGVIAFGSGWCLAGRSLSDPAFLSATLPYFLLMCAGSISSTIPDINGDREGGKSTTAVVLGEKKAHLFALVFVMAASAYSLAAKDIIASICAIAALPFYLLFILFPRKAFAEATYKVGGALCMAAAACILPVFLPCALGVLLATRIYFRLRHGISYPSLVPAAGTSLQLTGKTTDQ